MMYQVFMLDPSYFSMYWQVLHLQNHIYYHSKITWIKSHVIEPENPFNNMEVVIEQDNNVFLILSIDLDFLKF